MLIKQALPTLQLKIQSSQARSFYLFGLNPSFFSFKSTPEAKFNNKIYLKGIIPGEDP